MIDNFQKEIPRARINITLDVEIGGAKKKKELPLKILTINDFTGGKTTVPIAQRERININKTNFDDVLADLSPELVITIPNTINQNNAELRARLVFKKYRDFHPEQIVTQIPELNNLLAMRNLLKDLKANILDNTQFRQELEKIVKEQVRFESFREELKRVAVVENN